MPETDHAPTDEGRPNPHRTLRPVHQLSHKQARQMGHTLLAGVPERYKRLVLDTYILERRLSQLGGRGSAQASLEFLNRIATEGKKSGQSDEGALFWVLRTRNLIRASTRSPAPMEPIIYGAELHPLQTRPAPSTYQIRAMASWACRRYAPQSEILQICLQVYYEIRIRPRSGTTYRFPRPETAAWIEWVGIACSTNFKIPDEKMGTTTDHRIRWQELFSRSDNAAILSEVMPHLWAKTSYSDATRKELERGLYEYRKA